MACSIASGSAADVELSTTDASDPNWTMATESSGRRRETSRSSAALTVSSRLSIDIEPDVSITNVSATGGRCDSGTLRAWMPTRTRTERESVNGVGAPST